MIMANLAGGHGTPDPESGSRLAPPSARQSVHRIRAQIAVIMEVASAGLPFRHDHGRIP
jgi:hypothetical protein